MKNERLLIRHPALQAIKSLVATALLCSLITLSVVSTTPPAQADESNSSTVYLAGSGNPALDHHLKDLLEQHFEPQNELVLLSDGPAALIHNAPIVTLGPSAFSRIRQTYREASVLALLVEPGFLESFARSSGSQVSGIYHGAPLLRQALIGKAILPQATKIALIATSSTAELYDSLIGELPAYGLEAELFTVDNDKQLIPALNRALSYGDFLLAAPDNTIYNPRTIKHVLLTAYRRNRILIGPSQAYVKAGSLASGYAPFPAMAEMAAAYLQDFFRTGEFPQPGYPTSFRIEINEQVARSLNIPLPTQQQLIKNVHLRFSNQGGQEDE